MAQMKTGIAVADGLHQRDVVSSLERGLLVLTAFDRDAVEMTPSDVAKKTDLPRAATRRILLTLCKLGYAASDGKYFRLTPKVLDLAHNYLRTDDVRNLIEPIMRDAVDRIKDGCTLNIRDGTDAVAILACNAVSFGAVNVSVGLRIPLYVATPGRVVLAEMPQDELDDYLAEIKAVELTPSTIVQKATLRAELERVRQQGYAVGREEWEVGVYAVSVPLRNGAGFFVGCLTFVGNVARIQNEVDLNRRIDTLRRAAHQIGSLLPNQSRIGEMLNVSTSA